MDGDYILSIKNLTLGFLDQQNEIQFAVNGLNIDIPKGKTFVLLGESGCGKSVTANAILQLLPDNTYISPNSKIEYQGVDLLSQTDQYLQNIRGKEIGMIFQDPMTALNPVIKIGTQIMEMLLSRGGLSKTDSYVHALALLKEVGIEAPKDSFHKYPHQFSGGQKQRIMIAIALAGKPKLLIADEPTTALDVTTQAHILLLLKKLQDKYGLSMLLITHDIGVASIMGDQNGVMYAGHIVELHTSRNLREQPLHPYTQELMASIPDHKKADKLLQVSSCSSILNLNMSMNTCRYIERCPLKMDICRKVLPSWKNMQNNLVRCHLYDDNFMSVRDIKKKISHAEVYLSKHNEKDAILLVRGLSVEYSQPGKYFWTNRKKIAAVDNVSFSLNKGKTIALVGESGSGKTSTGRAILDLISKTKGRIYLKGVSLSKIHPKFRKNMQIVFQDVYSSLNPKLTIRTIITEGLKLYEKNPTIIENKLRNVIKQVGLSYDMLERFPHQFSGGQRQRIAIARSLILSPELMILDEPTSALDVSIQAQILNLLKKIQAKNKISYVLISHDMSVVGYMADEIAVMYRGKIIEYGMCKEILENPRHPYTQDLISAMPDNLDFSNFGNNNKHSYTVSTNDYLSFKDIWQNRVSFSETHHVYCYDDYDRAYL